MQLNELLAKVVISAEEDWVRPMGHHTLFHRFDVNLTIGSTQEGDDIQRDDYREDWANDFEHGHATGYYYNVKYGNTIIERVILVSVDGGRALLPAPMIGTKEVSKLAWAVAELFDTLGSLIKYADAAGLRRKS